jgi:hypothetical protein
VLVRALFLTPRRSLSLIVRRAVRLSQQSVPPRSPAQFIQEDMLRAFDRPTTLSLVAAVTHAPTVHLPNGERLRGAFSSAMSLASKMAQTLSLTQKTDPDSANPIKTKSTSHGQCY